MSWGENILENPSAETQDTTGWIVAPPGSVTVVENEIMEETQYFPIVDERETWHRGSHKIFVLSGNSGDYSFVFDKNAQMSQILTAEEIGEIPNKFQMITNFKFITPQDMWDTNVLGLIILCINYDDGSKDYSTIPCIKGITINDRLISNFWIHVCIECPINIDKTLDFIKVTAKTINCSNELHIDLIELRKEE